MQATPNPGNYYSWQHWAAFCSTIGSMGYRPDTPDWDSDLTFVLQDEATGIEPAIALMHEFKVWRLSQ